MPSPFSSGPVATIGAGALAGLASSFTDPLLRGVSQFGNRLTLTAIPDPGSLFSMGAAGLMSPQALYQALQWHGILLGTGGVMDDFQSGLWRSVLEAHRTVPGIDQVQDAWVRGLINDKAWELGIRRAGGNPQTWERLLPAYYALPSVGDLAVARNRNIIDPAQFVGYLRRHGFVLPEDQQIIDSLRLVAPTPSEVITWTVREAFDRSVSDALGYLQELPEAARQLFRTLGLYGTFVQANPDGSNPRTVEHVDMTWASHWQPISPGMAATMLHRVRPDNVGRYTSQGLDVQPFTAADVRRWLRISDYPPGIRDYLIATSYGVNRLVDIRNALKLGVRTREWAVGQFKDRGLHPDDAEFAADLAERQAFETRNAAVRAVEKAAVKVTIDAIRNAYSAGFLGREQAKTNLTEAGVSWAAADTILVGLDAAAFTKLYTRAVGSVRRDYLGGAINRAEAEQALRQLGTVEEAVQRYANVWSVELGHARRTASTQQIRDWYLEGLLSLEVAQARLRNLGWAEPEVQLHLTSYALKAQQAQAKRAAAAQQSQRQQAAQLEKLQKQLAAEQERVRATLRRLSPTSKLIVWYTKGIISEAFFRARMLSMGYDLGSTNQHFAEAQQRREEYEQAQAEKRAAEEAKAPGA